MPTPRFAAANTPANKDALKAQTEEAAARGMFGAPSFTVGDELFWGNDRLERRSPGPEATPRPASRAARWRAA